MIQQAFGGIVSLMLVKFMMNDVPHAVGLLDKHALPASSSPLSWEDFISGLQSKVASLLREHDLHPDSVWLVGGIIRERVNPELYKWLGGQPSHKDIDILLVFPEYYPKTLREAAEHSEFFDDLFKSRIINDSFDGLPLHILPSTELPEGTSKLKLLVGVG